jgi:uncharacterized protein with GYD domain
LRSPERGCRLVAAKNICDGEGIVTRYVLLTRNDSLGAGLMLTSGADGAALQRAAVKDFGGEVLHHTATIGHVDAVMVVDFPSPQACIAFCLAANAGGQRVEALQALTPDDMEDASRQAHDVARIQQERREKAAAETAP